MIYCTFRHSYALLSYICKKTGIFSDISKEKDHLAVIILTITRDIFFFTRYQIQNLYKITIMFLDIHIVQQ